MSGPTSAPAAGGRSAGSLLGRSFVHPVFDTLVIAGGFSLLLIGYGFVEPGRLGFGSIEVAGESVSLRHWVLLACNSAHLGASAVRLYTRPGAIREMPRLTLLTPLLGLLLLVLVIADAARLGHHAMALYMTWSPFHYAAQAYGIAVIYALRSGCPLGAGEKRLLRWCSLLPFVYAVLRARDHGLGWVVPAAWLEQPLIHAPVALALTLLPYLVFGAPLLLYAWIGLQRGRGPLPLMGLLAVVANGAWWTVRSYADAFTWATIFHSLQYLALVMVFHVKEQTARPGNRRGPLFHSVTFYAASLALAYAALYALPHAFVFLGFGFVESLMVVVAAVNIHHFVVDAFVWRVSRGGANRRIVQGEARAP